MVTGRRKPESSMNNSMMSFLFLFLPSMSTNLDSRQHQAESARRSLSFWSREQKGVPRTEVVGETLFFFALFWLC
jgi:hypothetical protein